MRAEAPHALRFQVMSPSESVSVDVVLGDLGALLLDAGVSVTDVRGTLERARDATAPDEGLAFAVLPEHVLVNRPGVRGATTIAAGEGFDLTFRQTAHASRLARRLEAGNVGLDQVPAHIAHIRGIRRRHPGLERTLGGALLAAGLAVLFRCPWWAVVLALLVGALVAAIVLMTDRISAAAAVIPFVASFVSTLIVGVVADRLDFGAVPLFAVCAPVAMLVPGALITNALLELTAADIVSGASRLIYGLIMLGFMAAGHLHRGHRDRPARGSALRRARRRDLAGDRATRLGGRPAVMAVWVGVVVLAIGIGLSFGAGFRLTVATVIVMICTYAALRC